MLVIVIEALLRISKRALAGTAHLLIACLAFIGIFFLQLPFPLIIALSAVAGFFFLTETVGPGVSIKSESAQRSVDSANANTVSGKNAGANARSTATTVIIWLVLWFVPLLLTGVFSDTAVLTDVGAFFSKLAVVTFGGAYTVLAYLAQDVVTHFGWLSAGEMMDGLALAETTPGPLILVTEFVGFLAGYRDGGWATGLAAAVMTLWVTFVPCFLWIFAGAPYIEWLGQQPRLRSALSAITAAVVGVILNLSVWFALHVFFQNVQLRASGVFQLWLPQWSTLDWRVVLLTALCAVLAFVRHWNIIWIIVTAAVSGVALQQLPA